MANISVSYEELNSSAARLNSGRDDINTKLAELQSLITGLVSSGFVTDKSSGAFQASYEEFNRGAKVMINGLEGLGTYLRNAASTLSEVDAALAARLH